MHEKISIVENILGSLGLYERKRIYVFNKIDNVQSFNKEEISTRYSEYSPQFISAENGKGVKELIQAIEQTLSSSSHK
jgi:50S ribosomal subunit-associated GTPase HflX